MLNVYVAEKLSSSIDGGILSWFYIIAESNKQSKIIFIDYFKKYLIDEIITEEFVSGFFEKPRKKLDLYKECTKYYRWRIKKLPNIHYSGIIKGIKVDLSETKFTYKW